MILLNSKSILDCNDLEETIHTKEIENIIEKIYNQKNYECAIIFKFVDEAHKNKEECIKSCKLHSFMEMIEYVDFKNGIDFAIEDNGALLIIAYGQEYELNGKNQLVETHIYIMPFDDNRNFVNIL